MVRNHSKYNKWLLRGIKKQSRNHPRDYPDFHQIFENIELTLMELDHIVDRIETTWILNELNKITQLLTNFYSDYGIAESMLFDINSVNDVQKKNVYLLRLKNKVNPKFYALIDFEIERNRMEAFTYKQAESGVKVLPPVRNAPPKRTPYHAEVPKKRTGSKNVPVIFQGTGRSIDSFIPDSRRRSKKRKR